MESQLHHDDLLHTSGADRHEEDEHGVEKKSTLTKVKAKVHKLKATIKHGHDHHDDAEKIMNESPAVRSGLVEPTDMGKPVLAEDLYATHSDIMDTPVRSFAQWEEEEKHGAPPPLPTGVYGTVPPKVTGHRFNEDVNREQLRGSIGKSTVVEEHPSAPTPEWAVPPVNHQTEVFAATMAKPDPSQVGHHGFDQDVNREQLKGGTRKSVGMETTVSPANQQTEVLAPTSADPSQVGHRGFDQYVSMAQLQDPSAPNPTATVSPPNHQTKVTDPTKTGGKEAGITDVLRSFNKMGVYDEPHSKSSESDQNEPKVYTGTHDQYSKSSESDQNEPKVYTGTHDQYSKSSESDQNEPKVYSRTHDQYSKSPESDQNEPKGYTKTHDQYSKSSESDQHEPKLYTGTHDQYKSSESDQEEPKVYTKTHDQYSKSSESDKNEPKVYSKTHDQYSKSPVSDQNEPKGYTRTHDQYSKSSESDQHEPKLYTGTHDQYKSSESDQNEPKVYTKTHDQYPKSSESDQNEPKVYTKAHDQYSKSSESHDQYSKSSESDQKEPKVYTRTHDQYSKSSESDENQPKVYTGSHDQFAPEPVEDAPISTHAGYPSSHSGSYTEETASATSDKAAVAKDLMVSKLGENESETKPSLPTNYAHKVAETVTGTLGPVYETVVGVGSSVMSKMQGSERPATTRITEKKEGSVKDYLVETLKPGDEDKAVSDVITHVLHRNDPPVQEITSTTIYVRDESGEGRSLQESGN